jgi:hypothetical protein
MTTYNVWITIEEDDEAAGTLQDIEGLPAFAGTFASAEAADDYVLRLTGQSCLNRPERQSPSRSR